MSYKKEGWKAADVRCPFYLSHDRAEKNISCEGCGENTELSIRFRSLPVRDTYMGLYCAGRFERCPMYKCTYEAKYADDRP